MAVRKTASKTSSRVKLDLDIDEKSSKRAGKKIKKTFKKSSPTAILLAVILLIVGAVGGYFGCKFLTKNDKFEIIGKDEITLSVGESYTDEGVSLVAFGQDEADKVKIETNLKKNEDGEYYADAIGTYYIAYTVDNLKYGSIFKVQKIRLINFVEPAEDDEIISAGGNV